MHTAERSKKSHIKERTGIFELEIYSPYEHKAHLSQTASLRCSEASIMSSSSGCFMVEGFQKSYERASGLRLNRKLFGWKLKVRIRESSPGFEE